MAVENADAFLILLVKLLIIIGGTLTKLVIVQGHVRILIQRLVKPMKSSMPREYVSNVEITRLWIKNNSHV